MIFAFFAMAGGAWADSDVTIKGAANRFGKYSGTNPKVYNPIRATANAAVTTIKAQLNAGRSVTINTASTQTGNGDLTLLGEIAITGRRAPGTLDLRAQRDLLIAKPLRATRTKLPIILRAGRNMTINAPITTNGGNLAIHATEPLDPAQPINAGVGTISIQSGSLASTQPRTLTASTVHVAAGAALRTRGSVSSDLSVAGTFSPGIKGNLDFTVNGNLSLQPGSTTAINLSSALQFGKIVSKGTVAVAGSLEVDCIDGFEDLIVTGQAFTIISAASITGTFDGVPEGGRVYLPDQLGSLKVNYTATAVALSDWQPVITDLVWDPGTVDEGTEIYTNARVRGRRHYFRVHTEVTDIGAWRTRLTTVDGREADLYMRRNSLPATSGFEFRSNRAGADGFVLNEEQFAAGQDWFLLVYTGPTEPEEPASAWSLLSGRAYVQDVGLLPWNDLNENGTYEIGEAPVAHGSGPQLIHGEGMRFFKATLPSGAPAWSLWLNGRNESLAVRQLAAPFHTAAALYERKQNGQLLIVPPVLVSGVTTYFASVVGNPGDEVNLDSRIQEVIDIPFESTVENVTVPDAPYRVYRVQVPLDQIAWDVSTTPLAGNPNIAVRKGFVAAEYDNDAFSEVPGAVRDSITLVPNFLSDGAWYITVYGQSAYDFTLRSGSPVVTPIQFTDVKVNDQPLRAGWRYYALTDINAQLGAHGWLLELANQVPGTEIALRRNAVPSRWRQRKDGLVTVLSSSVVEYSGKSGFLDRPAHQPDVWYVGVYVATEPLGAFTLSCRGIEPPPITFDGGTHSVENLAPGRWTFLRVNVPAGVLGWDARIHTIHGGAPQIAVRHDLLPEVVAPSPFSNLPNGWTPSKSLTWPTGNQWKGTVDWTGYTEEGDGKPGAQGVVSAMGRPLEPGSYYIGVLNTSATEASSFVVQSRGIGPGQACPVPDLAYNGGEVVIPNLAPREARYFKTTIPPNTPSWEVVVDATVGDVQLMARHGAIPDFNCNAIHTIYRFDQQGEETEIRKIGQERYVLLPPVGSLENPPTLPPGDYYLAVVSEGINPSGTAIGTETASAVIRSLGPLAVTQLGTATAAGINQQVTLVAGQIKAFQFNVDVDTKALEFRLLDPVGSPVMTVLDLPVLPAPKIPSEDSVYGLDGGIVSTSSTGLINASNPAPGIWSVLVNAPPTSDATATLNIVARGPVPVQFDGGVSAVTEHLPGTWRYFKVEVPAGAHGWDFRVRNVEGANPALMIRRDAVPTLNVNNQPTFLPAAWRPHTDLEWFSGYQWLASIDDWTGYSSDPGPSPTPVPDRIVAGMGRPLQPGTYYAGVYNNSGSPIAYAVDSRGIGNQLTYPVTDLNYAGGTAQVANLSPREARYFRVTVPANAPSWEVVLAPGTGEVEMLVRHGAIPDFFPLQDNLIYRPDTGGEVEMKKVGAERFVLLPDKDQSSIPAGDYYVAVVSEGIDPVSTTVGTGVSTAQITSVGPLAVKDLGIPSAEGTTEQVELEAGQIRAYKVTVPPNTMSLEARLELPVGNPQLSLGPTEILPTPPGFGADTKYGWNSGAHTTTQTHNTLITKANPEAGTWTILVRGGRASTSVPFGPSSAQLVVTALTTVPLNFDGGSFTVTGQQPASWKYFTVEVPADALGWDVRLRDVTGAIPALLVRRDQVPFVLPNSVPANHPSWTPTSSSTWPSGHQWVGTVDWTNYLNKVGDPAGPPGLVAAMGRPLEAGTYFVGVFNNRLTPTSYTIGSRGIGAGRIYEVTDLPFSGGSAPITDLLPREPKYFKVTIPAETPSWEMSVSTSAGDLQAAVRLSHVPDFSTSTSGSIHNAGTPQLKFRKAGNERYLLLPNASDFIPAGDYYIAVVSDGVNPNRTNNIVGAGPCSGIVTSHGVLPITDFGVATIPGVSQPVNLVSAQTKGFRLEVPTGTEMLEVRIENAVGYPEMTVASGNRLPAPASMSNYGALNGGATPVVSASIQTFVNPKVGPWQVAVRATEAPSGAPDLFPDASATLVVRQKPNYPLNFDPSQNQNGLSNTDTRQAIDGEHHIYKITPPATLNGQPVLGWVLRTEVSQGAATVRVFKDFANMAAGVERPAGTMVVVPPWLTFDQPWYVLVKASGTTHYQFSSRAITLERPVWTMPEPHNETFGDSGSDAGGNPLPGDRGIDLQQGSWHFFAVDVPANNRGLLRTELQAISGNPDLYIREDGVPTTDHNASGASGAVLIDRTLSNATTSYGNWVPLNGRTEKALRAGRWFLGVRAGNASNVRYRLIVSTGTVREMALNPATATAQLPSEVTGQVLADNDWRYYRFTVPETAPENWKLTFSQSIGDVVMRIRDTVPPGQEKVNTKLPIDIADAASDAKNQGPYSTGYDIAGEHTLTTPPLRPGHVYYVGFRSNNSATFSVSSQTSGTTVALPPALDFYTGTVSTTIPGNGSVMYRIVVPAEATRFKYTATHSSSVSVRIEQGTLAAAAGSQHYASAVANSNQNVAVSPSAWPWQPGETYWVRFVNSISSPQPIQFTLSGKNAQTEDEDLDGLLDAWERQWFGNISQSPTGDPDTDGVTNAVEFADGTAPNDGTSAKYTVTVLAKNGTASVEPAQAKYDRGAMASVSSTPADGYDFLCWVGGPVRSDDFAIKATGTMTIPTGGTWTFGVHSGDGVRLVVNGVTVVSDPAAHEPRLAFGQIVLQPGTYPVDLVAYERTGGESLELFAAAGSFTTMQPQFRLVGDVPNGGLAVETVVNGAATPGFLVRHVAPQSGLVAALITADQLLASTAPNRLEVTGVIDSINFLDFNAHEGSFGNNAHFPLNSGMEDQPMEFPVMGNYTVTALHSLPLEVGTDAANVTWQTGGLAPWMAENDGNAFDGVDLAGSGPIGDGQSSTLQAIVQGPGTLSFRWRVSSLSGDNLVLSLNGATVTSLAGETQWALRTMNIPAGQHRVTWTYSKNSSGSGGTDRGYVDQVTFTP